jgi:hypothetical protein
MAIHPFAQMLVNKQVQAQIQYQVSMNNIRNLIEENKRRQEEVCREIQKRVQAKIDAKSKEIEKMCARIADNMNNEYYVSFESDTESETDSVHEHVIDIQEANESDIESDHASYGTRWADFEDDEDNIFDAFDLMHQSDWNHRDLVPFYDIDHTQDYLLPDTNESDEDFYDGTEPTTIMSFDEICKLRAMFV